MEIPEQPSKQTENRFFRSLKSFSGTWLPNYFTNRFWHQLKYIIAELIPKYLAGVVALFALWVAYNNGLFEIKKATLEFQKAVLQNEIAAFTEERNTIIAERDGAIIQRDKAFLNRDYAIAERDKANAEHSRIQSEKNNLVAENTSLKTSAEKARQFALALVNSVQSFVQSHESTPGIKDGILLTEDGEPILASDGTLISVDNINTDIAELKKNITTFDETFDKTFKATQNKEIESQIQNLASDNPYRKYQGIEYFQSNSQIRLSEDQYSKLITEVENDPTFEPYTIKLLDYLALQKSDAVDRYFESKLMNCNQKSSFGTVLHFTTQEYRGDITIFEKAMLNCKQSENKGKLFFSYITSAQEVNQNYLLPFLNSKVMADDIFKSKGEPEFNIFREVIRGYIRNVRSLTNKEQLYDTYFFKN